MICFRAEDCCRKANTMILRIVSIYNLPAYEVYVYQVYYKVGVPITFGLAQSRHVLLGPYCCMKWTRIPHLVALFSILCSRRLLQYDWVRDVYHECILMYLKQSVFCVGLSDIGTRTRRLVLLCCVPILEIQALSTDRTLTMIYCVYCVRRC